MPLCIFILLLYSGALAYELFVSLSTQQQQDCSPFRLVFTVLPGFTINCNTPQECFMYFTVDSCLTSMSPTICSAGIFNILVFIYCIVQGFSIGIATWYLIYYHISFEEKPYSLLTPGSYYMDWSCRQSYAKQDSKAVTGKKH